MFVLSPLSSRNQIPLLLNSMGLINIAAEVGTHLGIYARIILTNWKGKKLLCIDPWTIPNDYQDQAKFLEGGGKDRSHDFAVCRSRLHDFRDRVEYLRFTSKNALPMVQDGSLDFVYLDGNHKPPHVEFDIVRWWYKLRQGGILAGHDIVTPGSPNNPENWGKYIQPAVLRLLGHANVYLIVEEGNLPWSYYVIKGEGLPYESQEGQIAHPLDSPYNYTDEGIK